VVAVFAVAAGAFAAVNLAAGGRTGAASPEAAVEQFFGALADEDLIGMLEVLDTGERDVLIAFVSQLESDLSRLGITEDVDLGDVPGIDFEVEGLQVSSVELTTGLSEVTIDAGWLSYRTEPESVPIGEVLRDLIEANDGEVDIREERDQADLGQTEDFFLVAVESGGRWHLSLSFTIAEYARRDAGLEVPSLDAGVVPQGGSDPEDAVRQFVDAAADLDLERMIALLPPDEMRALQAYAPLFLEDAQADLEQFRLEEGFSMSIDELELEADSVEGATRVVPTAGSLSLDTYDGDLTVSYRDGCTEFAGELAADVEEELGDDQVCFDDVDELDLGISDEAAAELRELGSLIADFRAGVVVVERDGAYYVDPLRTVSDLLLQAFAGIERSDLEEGGILYRLFTGELALFEDGIQELDDWDDGRGSRSCAPSDDPEDC
jgi:hypothetical protein